MEYPRLETATLGDVDSSHFYGARCQSCSHGKRLDLQALASYAKQAGDETLHRYADRIKARAVRRTGELAKRIEPAKGSRTDLGRVPTQGSRKSAATDAGLSSHQLKQAIRVANVPREEFDLLTKTPVKKCR